MFILSFVKYLFQIPCQYLSQAFCFFVQYLYQVLLKKNTVYPMSYVYHKFYVSLKSIYPKFCVTLYSVYTKTYIPYSIYPKSHVYL